LFSETGSHCVAQTILLPQPPEYWDYRHAPPHQAALFFISVGRDALDLLGAHDWTIFSLFLL
jgi:hypothetical protein